MSIYTALVSRLLFPLHERLKKHSTVAVRRDLERSQWLAPAELEELRLRKLRGFLGRIARDVPYYRDLFRELGFEPGSIASVADLTALPLLDKETIRRNSERLIAENAADLSRFNTGGSSGEPLIFYLGKDRVSHDVAAKWRATRWWNVDIGDRELVVWGSPIELGAQDRVRLWRDRLFRTALLPAFEMSADNLDRFVAQIRKERPRMLFGYPSSLAMIAGHARDTGVAMDDLGIRVVFVTSERLYDNQREAIEGVFGCPVANGYGGRDAGFIAHECPEGSLHITAEDIIVETVDESGSPCAAGEPGEIVVTHMHTADYPFLRYRTGDVGVLATGACSCGRGLPVLERIEGRTTDFVHAMDGTVLHGLSLIYVLRDMESVAQFRIVQESLDRTVVSVVPRGQFSDEARAHVEAQFRERLGGDVTVDVVLVEKIDREKSGKFRYVVSHVVPGSGAGSAAEESGAS